MGLQNARAGGLRLGLRGSLGLGAHVRGTLLLDTLEARGELALVLLELLHARATTGLEAGRDGSHRGGLHAVLDKDGTAQAARGSNALGAHVVSLSKLLAVGGRLGLQNAC